MTYDHKSSCGHREVQASHHQIGCLQTLQHAHAVLQVIHPGLERTQPIREGVLELLELRLGLLTISWEEKVPNDLPASLSPFGMANHTAK
ncbi:hypothetical protein D3C76_1508900 [compost metagenome]